MTPPLRMKLLSLVLLAGSLASCDCGTRIQSVTSKLRFELVNAPTPTTGLPTLTFPGGWADGVTRTQPVHVIVDGRTALDVTWQPLTAPLGVQDLPQTLQAGTTTLNVTFTPTEATQASQRLQVAATGLDPAVLQVVANAAAEPVCTPSDPCKSAHFDSATSACVEDVLADGTACTVDSKCLQDTTCQAGRCVGTAVTCEDGNACTVDVCYPLTGCEHVPAPPCPGDGVCQVGTCDPMMGCLLAPATDGTACGALQTCGAAQVCIDGACVVRDPPDGYVCEEATPCTDEGRCVADQCVHQQPPTVLNPAWSYDSLLDMDDAGVTAQYHDFVMEPTGELSLGGFFFSPPLLRANTTHTYGADGVSRRCVLWNGHVVCADYPSAPNGKVSAIDPATGRTLWTFDIRTARPDFVMLTSQIFLARLVVQGSDRLAALFESYPKNPPVMGSSLCRAYFLAVIDATGHLVTAQQVVDPLLDGCNHPHPYGVAADSVGNLYISFSPTRSQMAPLVPDVPTLIMSYTHDGIFRWKRTNEELRGGELAIARGLLYPENAFEVLNATSGEPAFTLPTLLGRAVVSDTRLIPAPLDGDTRLLGYEAGSTSLRWTNTLPTGWTFWGEQLRLASWSTSTGARTVALAFVTNATTPVTHALYGVEAATGRTVFKCPITGGDRTVPQLLEVGDGKLGVMEGALDVDGNPACLKCDPPLAGSSAAFQTYDVPWLSTAHESWVGTFGGAGHDHREE